jgi:GNAT superfamily N-acetyltransferase
MEVTVRAFTPADQDGAAELYLSGMNNQMHIPIYGRCYQWFVDDKLKPEGDMRNIQRVYMESHGNKGCFWVAEYDGHIVGIVGAVPSETHGDDYVELVRMFVSPKLRGQGVGRRLVQALENWAASVGYKRVHLSTLSALLEPNQFYPKYGFILVNTQTFEFSEMLSLPSPAYISGNYYEKEVVTSSQ